MARIVLACIRTMSRLASVALLISVLSGCGPRTKLALGGAATIAGGVLIASVEPVEYHSCGSATRRCFANFGAGFQELSNGITYLIGGIIIAAGAGIMLSGARGLSHENARKRFALLAPSPLPAPASDQAATTAAAVPSDPRAVLLFRARSAARIGRCDVTADAAKQLEELDAAMYAELSNSDERVAHCVAWSRL
jgi:hypothetical protein